MNTPRALQILQATLDREFPDLHLNISLTQYSNTKDPDKITATLEQANEQIEKLARATGCTYGFRHDVDPETAPHTVAFHMHRGNGHTVSFSVDVYVPTDERVGEWEDWNKPEGGWTKG